MHVFTSLFLDRLLQLPKVWMVLEMSVRVRETSGSLKRERSDTLTHGELMRRETRPENGDRHAAIEICQKKCEDEYYVVILKY